MRKVSPTEAFQLAQQRARENGKVNHWFEKALKHGLRAEAAKAASLADYYITATGISLELEQQLWAHFESETVEEMNKAQRAWESFREDSLLMSGRL